MDTMAHECSVNKAMDFIAKKWSLLIILELYKGAKRFNEIKNSLKTITPKILTTRLRELEELGAIIRKEDRSSVPIKVEYSLSKSGKGLVKIIGDIKKWSLKWCGYSKVCDSTDCQNCPY